MALPLMTQSNLIENLAEETGFSKGEIRNVLHALEAEVHDALKNCERIKIAGITVEPKIRKATKARIGRNPRTGEEVRVSAKPASVRVALRADKNLKATAPTVRKLQAAL
jgi:nucleoid DNA-binding protein